MFARRRAVTILALCGGTAALAYADSTPTFTRDIAPILYQNCAPCHRAAGSGPFPLVRYDDVKKHAHQIADVTGRRYMPPWPPQLGYGAFQDERRLTDEQIRCIAEWVRTGAAEGPATALPVPPTSDGDWQLGAPDLVLKAAQPFTMRSSGPDVFWNFVFNPKIETIRNVRAIEIRPGGTEGGRNIHHANLLIDRMGSVRRLETAPGAGFAGMELTLDRNPFDPDSHFLFWKPGSLPHAEPDGLAWQLAPGNLLVLNTHMQPSGKSETISP
ncbi:MAG: cytochrome c, partial [Acidobacteriaceae bacterium]|nr:cytochrome c [Acidobacteriaceae bacterium]